MSPGAPQCPAMPGALDGAGQGEMSGSGWSVVLQGCLLGPSAIQADTAHPLVIRDSCQTLLAFWLLPAQARFKPMSCGWPWIPHHCSCEGLSLCFLYWSLFCRVGSAGAGYN